MGWEPYARFGLMALGYAFFGPVGGIAGAYAGSVLFPIDYETSMPTVHDMPIQSSAIGIPISLVYGTTKRAGNIIYLGPFQSYQVKHSASGGKGGEDEQTQIEIRYRRSFLISICEGPATIGRAWKGKEEIPISDFTSFDGIDNRGISTLIGEDYAKYSNLCLAYFEDYELGNSQAIPNFSFEVSADVIYYMVCGGTDDESYCSWRIDNDASPEQQLLADAAGISYASVVCKSGAFYVTADNIIWKFNKDGTVDTSWQTNGSKGGFGTTIFDLALDSDENLYVVNGRKQIDRFKQKRNEAQPI